MSTDPATVLLVMPEALIAATAQAIAEAATGPVHRSLSLAEATRWLRQQEWGAVVIEQGILERDPQGARAFWKAAEPTMVLVVAAGVMSAERLAREVRSGLLRLQRERQAAARRAWAALREEIGSALTGMLLSAELALAEPELPPRALAALQSSHAFAMALSEHLADPGDVHAQAS